MITRTLEQAAETQGITIQGGGLRLHFSPLPNWYGCILGFDCPCCEQPIEWEWVGGLPGFTCPETIDRSGVTPRIKQGAKILGWGHRYINLECSQCGVTLYADNFD